MNESAGKETRRISALDNGRYDGVVTVVGWNLITVRVGTYIVKLSYEDFDDAVFVPVSVNDRVFFEVEEGAIKKDKKHPGKNRIGYVSSHLENRRI
jgi:hypothetical protein